MLHSLNIRVIKRSGTITMMFMVSVYVCAGDGGMKGGLVIEQLHTSIVLFIWLEFVLGGLALLVMSALVVSTLLKPVRWNEPINESAMRPSTTYKVGLISA